MTVWYRRRADLPAWCFRPQHRKTSRVGGRLVANAGVLCHGHVTCLGSTRSGLPIWRCEYGHQFVAVPDVSQVERYRRFFNEGDEW